MLDYGGYEEGCEGSAAKDHVRHVITLQLTKLLMNQNLELTLNAYYSPSDRDAYLMPKIHHKYTDQIGMEIGGISFSAATTMPFLTIRE